MADLYENPTVRALAATLDEMSAPAMRTEPQRAARPRRRRRSGRSSSPSRCALLSGLRWLTWVAAGNNLAASVLGPGLPADGLVVVGRSLGWVTARLRARADGAQRGGRADPARRVRPGDYPRGGRIHLRLWLAERLADELGAANLAGAAWMPTYARALGAKVGKQVDLHSIPPVTGMLTLGDGCSVEPEVDLSRPLARRRRAAHRHDQGRRRRPRRHPEHAVPGCRRRARRRGRPRVGGHRRGREGRVLDRLARRARRPHPRPVVRESPRPQARAGCWRTPRIATADLAAADRGRPWPGSRWSVPWLRDTDSLGEAALVLLALAAAGDDRRSGRPGAARRRPRPAARDRAVAGRLPDPQPSAPGRRGRR